MLVCADGEVAGVQELALEAALAEVERDRLKMEFAAVHLSAYGLSGHLEWVLRFLTGRGATIASKKNWHIFRANNLRALHDADLALHAIAKRIERGLVARAVVRGDGGRDAVELNYYATLV